MGIVFQVLVVLVRDFGDGENLVLKKTSHKNTFLSPVGGGYRFPLEGKWEIC